MYKLLIIDDQADLRKEKYEQILKDEFEFQLVGNSKRDVSEKLEFYWDCILVDNNLAQGDYNLDSLFPEILAHHFPIVIVSEVREFTTLDISRKHVRDCISIAPLFQCLSMISEQSDSESLHNLFKFLKRDFCFRLDRVINSTLGYASAKNGDDKEGSSATVLHLSDLQFGDPHFEQENLYTFLAGLESFIRENGIVVSVVAISGDLGFSGDPKEYRVAKEKLQVFFKNIFWNDPQVVIIPGNHDYSCNAVFMDHNSTSSVCTAKSNSILQRMQASTELNPFPDQNSDNQSLKKFINGLVVTPDDFEEFEPTDISRFYFSKCCYQITNNTDYWKYPLFIKNANCRNVGLELIGIENAATYSNNGTNQRYKYSSDYRDITTTTGLLSVLVGHSSPDALGYGSICDITEDKKLCNDNQCAKKGMCKKWESMRVLLSKTRSIIYLYGHKHYSDYDLVLNDSCLFLGTGAPNKVNKHECSFSILKLRKNQNHSLSANYMIYSWDAGEVKVNTNKNFVYSFGDRKWQVNTMLSYEQEPDLQSTLTT